MHAAARQFNTTPKMVAKWIERPHNLRNVLAALASMSARRSLALTDAGSRTPAHISSSVAFEEASLLMPVYRWVASSSRMICGGITWTAPGTASGASPLHDALSLSGHSFHHQILVAKERLADSRPDAPQQCEKCTLRLGEALAAPAELCVMNGTLPL
ncbi:hypothetical protein IVB38_27150 [Bradyrhizobium sp. 38]|uniref:hypothetical protein n=1 Tax=unclassified Bradyrhizobium TaxID=2631580 RepID=UPI001FF943DB|nr:MULTISPECIES: hypothetical protein [unclassified Bradyrhizobium]MCK1339581.1 hypothetical protein [Bradyrhizobium sp. 38]MCK1778936.1 hypothetical protein [Bradyrhizobium sp. 132]